MTHPYWHLAERGITVDFASSAVGKVRWTPRSDPNAEGSAEADDLVSRGFLSDNRLLARLASTVPLNAVDPALYDLVHVAGGRGARFDLFPNDRVAALLEHFWASQKIVAAICHGAIVLANNPDRIAGRHVTGFSLEEDHELERLYGKAFTNPHYPQGSLEEAGALYASAPAHAPHVVLDSRLVTGKNQQSASEYGIALARLAVGMPRNHYLSPIAITPPARHSRMNHG